jgi:hypothetical protein
VRFWQAVGLPGHVTPVVNQVRPKWRNSGLHDEEMADP